MSLTNTDVLKSLKPGDIIKTTRTLKVTAPIGRYGPFVALEAVDVGNAHQELTYFVDDSPTLKIEMVKKVAKQRTDYKVGDVVSGDELRATMWKRGTIISHKDWQQTRYVLMPSGTWAHAEEAFDERETTRYGFERFTAPGYTIKYLP